MQTDLQKILAITNYHGLFRYLSQARQGIIVESLIDGKRMRVPAASKVSALSDITVFTDGEDLYLRDIFLKIKEQTGGEPTVSHKATTAELTEYFATVVPDYNRDKVFPSHIKKIVEWYNILQANDLLDFVAPDANDSESSNESETDGAPAADA
jgi:hypothetical protein